jgi:hypothetical protein
MSILLALSCGLYYKHFTIVNYDSNVTNKFKASLTNEARVLIYNRHMLIVLATGVTDSNP